MKSGIVKVIPPKEWFVQYLYMIFFDSYANIPQA